MLPFEKEFDIKPAASKISRDIENTASATTRASITCHGFEKYIMILVASIFNTSSDMKIAFNNTG